MRAVLSVPATAWMAFMGLAVAGALVPDQMNALPPNERLVAREALDGGVGCYGDWPLARIKMIRVDRDPLTVQWECALTILGWPSWTGQAKCVEGLWRARGYLDERLYGSCGDAHGGW